MTSEYILFSEGCYSDYQNAAYAVLKPFKLEDVTLLFLDQYKPDPAWDWRSKPTPGNFAAWMVREGYIRRASEITEVHLGDYDFDPDGIGLDLMRHEFAPPQKREE